VVGVQSSLTVWEPGKQPLPAKPRGKMGRPPRLLQRSADHQPVPVKQLSMSLPSRALQEITWREGMERRLRSRFAAVRVRPAHRDYEKAEPHGEEWLLIEWPRSEPEPLADACEEHGRGEEAAEVRRQAPCWLGAALPKSTSATPQLRFKRK
jgi:SRSO17 transposase